VYRFVSAGTLEDQIFARQMTKQALFSGVCDDAQINRAFTAADVALAMSSHALREEPAHVPKEDLIAQCEDLLMKQVRPFAFLCPCPATSPHDPRENLY
jgi:transcriptional regulator ATRX